MGFHDGKWYTKQTATYEALRKHVDDWRKNPPEAGQSAKELIPSPLAEPRLGGDSPYYLYCDEDEDGQTWQILRWKNGDDYVVYEDAPGWFGLEQATDAIEDDATAPYEW